MFGDGQERRRGEEDVAEGQIWIGTRFGEREGREK